MESGIATGTEKKTHQHVCIFANVATGMGLDDALHSTARVQLLSRDHGCSFCGFYGVWQLRELILA